MAELQSDDRIGDLPDPAGMLFPPTVTDIPVGYRVGVTRYADLVMKEAFTKQYSDLIGVLEGFRISADELIAGGGSRATHTRRFDDELGKRGWGKRNIEISKLIDGSMIHATRGHEIDMFSPGSADKPYPGVAVEMEWNNKDPFFDRDLVNFMALHREGALGVGVIVTRGPTLQKYIKPTIRTEKSEKYGASTTHWDKVVPRINLGGGGECPLVVIGIEPDRVTDFARIKTAFDLNNRLST